MTATNFKVETGIQLLARLSRKPAIENFYPILFGSGPKQNEVIEITSTNSSALVFVLADIVCETLVSAIRKGVEAKVFIFNMNGLLNIEIVSRCMKNKIRSYLAQQQEPIDNEVNNLVNESVKNMYFLDIFDAIQLYVSIHNLEIFLIEQSNVSLIVFDSITAFYWSEQDFKITKMDTYLSNLLRIIQKITNEFKVTLLYTRPEYFTSKKETTETLEACELPTLGRPNYRINLLQTEGSLWHANITRFKNNSQASFNITNGLISWL